MRSSSSQTFESKAGMGPLTSLQPFHSNSPAFSRLLNPVYSPFPSTPSSSFSPLCSLLVSPLPWRSASF